jgi:hypothetical protein
LVAHARRTRGDGEVAAELALHFVGKRALRHHEVLVRMIVRAAWRMLRSQLFEHLVALIGRQMRELLADFDDA